jgi:hypothetical protein
LTASLRVPERNIRLLKDEEAARAQILDAFESFLLKNNDIRSVGTDKKDVGDAIILYYAGHGFSGETSGNIYAPRNIVQGICPCDMTGAQTPEGSERVHPIPHYTMNRMLQSLAQSKGNNIVRPLPFSLVHSQIVFRPSSWTVVIRAGPHAATTPFGFPPLPPLFLATWTMISCSRSLPG